MKASSLPLFLSLFILHGSSAQELIKNGNFEMRTGYPTTYGQAYLIKYWNSETKGKWSGVNYFYDTKGEIRSYIPRMREGGKQAPLSGNGFSGLGLALKNVSKNGSQYLENQLLNPLEKDSIYVITAYVSLIEKAKYAIDYIPASLSDKKMLPKGVQTVKTANLIKLEGTTPFLSNTADWIKVTATYKAMGGEQYFIIGGIESNNIAEQGFKLKKTPFKFSFLYFILNKYTFYFIDDISVCKKNSVAQSMKVVPATVTNNTPKIKKNKIILKDVIFDVNSYTLKDRINDQLDELVTLLSDHQRYKLTITGYTDDTGTENANNKLSELRAKTIYEYLYQKGITLEHMEYKGLGESSPIADNKTAEGRSKNRRVEILIIE